MWRLAFAAVVVSGIAAAPTDGLAKPQALALLSIDAPVALRCKGGLCQAEFTAFCLEESKDAPAAGTPYRVLDPADLTIVITDAAGAVRRVAAGRHLTIVSTRGYAAVRMSLASAALADLGAARVAVEVGEGASLLPATVTDASGIERLRAAGTEVVDHDGRRANSARIINGLINALPRAGTLHVTERQKLWREIVARRNSPEDAIPIASVHDVFRAGSKATGDGDVEPLRACLQFHHDRMVVELTNAYWRIVGAGS